MDKIYLKLKKSISLNLQDDNWAFHEGDLLVIENIGEKLMVMNDGYGKQTRHVNDVWRLNEVVYKNLIDIKEITYELTTLKPNLISVKFKGENTLWLELSGDTRNDIMNLIFDDVTIEYLRDEKLEKLLK